MALMKNHCDGQIASAPRSIDDVVAAACRLAGQDAIDAVHVVASERPTYDELASYRQWADASGLMLGVNASGVSFRQRRLVPVDVAQASTPLFRPSLEPPRGMQHVVVWNRVVPALDWLSAHGRTWRDELIAMSERTR
jgi:hypothetical protein